MWVSCNNVKALLGQIMISHMYCQRTMIIIIIIIINDYSMCL